MSHCGTKLKQQVKSDWLNPSNARQLGDVLRIERLTNPAPWSLNEVRHLLGHGHLCRIVLVGEFVAGFLMYQACQGGRRITSIAVDPGVQRHGIGSFLIGCLKRQMAEVPRLSEIVAHVPESQLVVQQFLRSNGFRWTETIQNASEEGVYIMKCVKPSGSSDAVVAEESFRSAANPGQY